MIPDIPCSAGGVIASWFEWVQGLQYWSWTEALIIERPEQSLERFQRGLFP